jgi:hypothetical protein
MSPQRTFGSDEPMTDAIPAAPAPPRGLAEPDDGFLPMTRVVPRAKIVLHGNERLPDRDGQKTFAASGTRIVSPTGVVGAESNVPMYSFAYNPLYFEDKNLERCGLSCGCCIQPVVSGALFFGTVALAPYKILITPPCSCVFPSGECPAGCGFSCLENVLGPKPDFSCLKSCLSFSRREKDR